MAIPKQGLMDRVKEVAVQAGTRGAKVLLGTALLTAHGVVSLQSMIRGRKARGRAASPSRTRRTARAARGVIESGTPPKVPTRRRASPAKAVSPAAANKQTGRKSVPGQSAAARRGTAKQARPVKAKRGQKHRH